MMLWVLLAPLLFCTVISASTGRCPPVPEVPHAIPLSTDTSISSKIRYNCTHGYIHTGRRTKNACRMRGGIPEWSNNVKCSPDVGCDDPNPNAPPNIYIVGLPEIRGEKYQVGTVGNIKCTPGYERKRGHRNITCQSVGSTYQWTEYNTECTPRPCGDPGEPPKGGRDSDNRTRGTQVRFHCDAGYTLVGDSNRTCLANGTWTNHVPTCRLNCCGQLESPRNGSIRNNGNNCYLDTATVTCNKGYHISEPVTASSVTITCTSDGTWDTAVPTCLLCYPQSIPDGRVQVTGYSYADFINYECNSHTTTEGETYGQCDKNGQWTIPPPKCYRHCPEYKLKNGLNQNKSVLGYLRHKTRTQLTCSHGYQLSPRCEDESVVCNNGTWTGCISTCEAPPCTYTATGEQKPSAGGDDKTMYDQYTPIPSGMTITIQCIHGYEGGGRSACSHGILPEVTACTKMECTLPPSVGTTYRREVTKNSSRPHHTRDTTNVTVTGYVVYGEKVYISCDDGYRRHQTSTTCDAGEFIPPLETCQGSPCTYTANHGQKPSAHGDDGNMVYDQYTPIPSGMAVTIECLHGYEGGGRSTCSQGHLPEVAACTKMECTLPLSKGTTYTKDVHRQSSWYPYTAYITREAVTGYVVYGEKVHISCADGYRTDQPNTTCDAGVFIPALQTCKEFITQGTNCERTSTDDYEFDYQGIAVHGSRETYHCKKAGYIAMGEDLVNGDHNYVTCKNGRFYPIPSCKAPPCRVPPDTRHMEFLSTGTINTGRQVEYKCLNGARARDKTAYGTSNCTDGHWDPKPLCNPHVPVPGGYTTKEGDCFGNDIEGGRRMTRDECAAACTSLQHCVGWVYAVAGTRPFPHPSCYLKRAMCREPSPVPGLIIATYYKIPPGSCQPIQNTNYLDFTTSAVTAHNNMVRYNCRYKTTAHTGATYGFTRCVNGTWDPYPQCNLMPMACFVNNTDEINYPYTGYIQNGASVSYHCLSNTRTRDSKELGSSKCENGTLVPRPKCCPIGKFFQRISSGNGCEPDMLWNQWFRFSSIAECFPVCLSLPYCAGFTWSTVASRCLFLKSCKVVTEPSIRQDSYQRMNTCT